MPNWCHNTLTVTGDEDEVAKFYEAALERLDEDRLRADYDDPHAIWVGDVGKPTFDEYVAKRTAQRAPLSFDSIVPFIEADWPRTTRPCILCEATGTRADGLERFGPEWVEQMNGCNGCLGTGEQTDEEGWWRHHVQQWGTKWDCSFGSGPFMSLAASSDVDVDASVEAQGLTKTPTVLIYKFDTAWSPPAAFVGHASALFGELEFTLRFGEPGSETAGQGRWVAGICLEQVDLDITDVLAPEEMWF